MVSLPHDGLNKVAARVHGFITDNITLRLILFTKCRHSLNTDTELTRVLASIFIIVVDITHRVEAEALD